MLYRDERPLLEHPTSVRMDIIPKAALQEESKRFGKIEISTKIWRI
jgi:hypothetical protein